MALKPFARWALWMILLGVAWSQSPPLTPQQMREDLWQLRDALKEAWSHAEIRKQQGVDLDAISLRLQGRISEQTSPSQFQQLLAEFPAAILDGHAGLSGPNDQALGQLPFACRETQDGIIVCQTDAYSGLQLGDRLISMQGTPIQAWLAQRVDITSGSTQASRRYRAVAGLARVPAGTPVELVVDGIDGKRRSLNLQPRPWAALDDTITYARLADNIGYLRLATFTREVEISLGEGASLESFRQGLQGKFERIRSAFETLHDCRALVLDLRDNPGGSDVLGQYLAAALAPTGNLYYYLETQLSPEVQAMPDMKGATAGRHPSFLYDLGEKPATPYRGRLAVLMNEGSFSASDCLLNFLACCRPHTIFVGSPNGAGAGAPRTIVCLQHSQIKVSCCVMRVWNPNGQLIEGNPIQPTLPVRPNRADLARGRDVVLETALRALSRTHQSDGRGVLNLL